MNLLKRELRDNRNSLIYWIIGILFMVIAGMSKFEGMAGSGSSLKELWDQMPKALQALMGTGSLDISTVMGFFGIVFTFCVVMAAIHAVMLGSSILSKEERDKTSEFLMVKPRSRSAIITVKLIAALINVVLLNLATFASSLWIVNLYDSKNADPGAIALTMAGMFAVQLIFLSLGLAFAAISTHPKTAPSLSTGVMLGTYILSAAIDLNESLDWLKFLTPFKYFEADQLILEKTAHPLFILLTAVLIAAGILCTYFYYNKRDLYV